MSFLAKKLKHRIEIRQAIADPSDDMGFERSYKTLKTIWAGTREVSRVNTFGFAIRGEQVNELETHEFIIRKSSVDDLGRTFSTAFSPAFDSSADLNPLKDYYIFKIEGNAGRLFKIHGVRRDEDNNEFYRIRAEETEEVGTGHND